MEGKGLKSMLAFVQLPSATQSHLIHAQHTMCLRGKACLPVRQRAVRGSQ